LVFAILAKVAKRLGLGWSLAVAIIVGGIAVLGVPLALVASPVLVLAILQAFGGFWLALFFSLLWLGNQK